MAFRNRIIEYGVKPADQLLANPKNARVHPQFQRDVMKAALDEVGFVAPVIESKSGVLLDGHERLWQALQTNADVPFVVVDVDAGEEDYVLATFDPITNLAQYDAAQLDALLQDVNSDQPAIQQMLADLAEDAGLYLDNGAGDAPDAQVDRAAELQQKWQTERGQLWVIGKHRLLCGDSTNAEYIPTDVLITDPPYGIEVDTSWLTALNVQRGKPANMSDDTLAGDDGSLDLSFLFKYERRMIWGFPYIFDPQATGWIVWDKQPGVDERGITTPVEMASTTMRTGFDMVRCMWGGYYRAAGETRQPHPTQKPVQVIAPFIERWTKVAETVFDPFGGSGTTMVACEQLGRQCRMMELEPKYCAVILERMSGMGLTPELQA